jgi:hypothetical protein
MAAIVCLMFQMKGVLPSQALRLRLVRAGAPSSSKVPNFIVLAHAIKSIRARSLKGQLICHWVWEQTLLSNLEAFRPKGIDSVPVPRVRPSDV